MCMCCLLPMASSVPRLLHSLRLLSVVVLLLDQREHCCQFLHSVCRVRPRGRPMRQYDHHHCAFHDAHVQLLLLHVRRAVAHGDARCLIGCHHRRQPEQWSLHRHAGQERCSGHSGKHAWLARPACSPDHLRWRSLRVKPPFPNRRHKRLAMLTKKPPGPPSNSRFNVCRCVA